MGIRKITSYAREHEDEFVQMVAKKSQDELNKSLRNSKHELEQAQARIRKLDEIIKRLYEDNIEGKISDERFAKMSTDYEAEQQTLEARTKELKTLIAAEQERSANVDSFLASVKKYTDITELNAEIIREFVEKVYVYQSTYFCGKKVQKIKIVWNCIGDFGFHGSGSK